MDKFNELYNKIIMEYNDGKSLVFTNNMIRASKYNNPEKYRERKINLENYYCSLDMFKRKLIYESIIQNVNPLIKNILDKIENKQYEFTYSKDELIEFMIFWKYKEKFIKEVPKEFKLSILHKTEEEIKKMFGIEIPKNSYAQELLSPNDPLHEYINILNSNKRISYANLKALLEEELRHVWTYIFGYVDDNWYVGRTDFQQPKDLYKMKFNEYQKMILKDIFNNDLQTLQNEFNYIFVKVPGNDSNWELSVHIDAIIDLLIEDYFVNYEKNNFLTPQKYLNNVFNTLKSNNFNEKEHTILEHFYQNKDYENIKDKKVVKDNIKRLFLILGFGNDKVIKYFKTACEDEFGKIND